MTVVTSPLTKRNVWRFLAKRGQRPAYIETNLASGFIQQSPSPAAAPILFAKKKDSGLRLCVDYRALKKATIKTRYPLPLMSEMLEQLRGARILTKLDLWNAYHIIQIKEGDKYKRLSELGTVISNTELCLSA
jgi:hypothetical protein